MSLRIYPVILELVREVRRRYLPLIEAADSDLARQLKRALGSMALNCGEGMYSLGKNRRVRYSNSVASTREVLSCLEFAQAMDYIPDIDEALKALFDHVIGTLVNLVKPRQK